jgi:hypothetical protein
MDERLRDEETPDDEDGPERTGRTTGRCTPANQSRPTKGGSARSR